MCDATPVRNWLIGIGVALVAAAAIVIGAAVANGSWWYTYLSPIGMAVAAAAAGGAILTVGAAQTALTTFCKCAGPACAGACNNLSNTLLAARVVLGIEATACLTVAAYAWIPGAAQPAQWAIIGTFVAELFLITAAVAFVVALGSCQRKPAGPG